MAVTGLLIVARAHGRVSVVEVAGDLDLPGASRLMQELLRHTKTGARVVVCDLSRLVAGQDASLLMVFPAAQRRMAADFHPPRRAPT